MAREVRESDRAWLLARAQNLNEAELDDFGDEARQHWNGRQANLFKYSGDDQQLRKQLIDAGFAEVVQRGARSRPGILKIWPNGDAPRYVPRERARAGERTRLVRERTSVGVLNPRDVMKFTEYIRTRKEAWRVESRRVMEDEFADVAPAVNKLGFDRVRQYLDRVAGVSGSDGWRRHLRDQFGDGLVEFFGAEIDRKGVR
jgi:hypothetical protein